MTQTGQESIDLLVDFAAEAGDALSTLPDELHSFYEDSSNAEAINAVFRAVHSIKGNAGFFGLVAIKTFSHQLENTLDEVRKRKIDLTDDLLREVIAAVDRLDEMIAGVTECEPTTPLSDEDRQQLERVAQLSSLAQKSVGPEEQLLQAVIELAAQIGSASEPEGVAGQLTEIVEKYNTVAKSDSATGEAQQPRTGPPQPADLQGRKFVCGGQDITGPITEMLGFFSQYEPGPASEALAQTFVESAERTAATSEEAGDLHFAEALRGAAHDLKAILDSPLDLDDTLLSVVWDQLAGQLARLVASSDQPPVSSEEPSRGQSRDAKTANSASGKPRLIRVREERLEEFLECVSSLFITCEMFKDLQHRMAVNHQSSPLLDEMRQVTRVFSEQSTSLQKSLVSLRQLTAAGLFSRFPRLARSIASQLSKQLDVQILGGEVEIDKSLVEQLDAPLTHMIRNSVDHGIELPETRREQGKPETGQILLKAEKTRTHVVITIADDGAGIDPQRMRQKAVEKGMLSEADAAALSDQQAQELVLHPGFSTAEKLSDVSGRGVGMDVVHNSVRELNGELSLSSEAGIGTTIRLEFPLREAVLVVDGLMLEHAGQRFIVPFENIREIAEVEAKHLQRIQDGLVINIRGETYHAVSLSDVLDLPSGGIADGAKIPAVLVESKFGTLCLLADRLHGHRQVVVNGLHAILPGIDNLAGVAPLGGGHLALVLSVPDIVRDQGRSH